MSQEPLLIQAARIIDPSRSIDAVGDLLIRDGVIEAAGSMPADDLPQVCDTIDARGLVVCPGFIDIHCHLREPGYEHKETIATGTRAAAPRWLHHLVRHAQHPACHRQRLGGGVGAAQGGLRGRGACSARPLHQQGTPWPRVGGDGGIGRGGRGSRSPTTAAQCRMPP